MEEPKYFFSPTLLDCFCSYLNAEHDWEKYWGGSEDPKVTLAEYEEQKYQELIFRINRAPGEPLEAAEKGTAWNDLIDTLIHNKQCGHTKFTRLYNCNGQITEENLGGCRPIAVRAYTTNFVFDFDLNFAMNAAIYFGKTAITENGDEVNTSPSDKCLSQVLVVAPIETAYGVVELYGFIDEMRADMVIDIKTTSRYEFGKYRDYNQRHIYPYCLIESGMMESVKSFEFTAYVLNGGNERNPLITGTQYREVYDYNHEQSTKHIKSVCERFIEFINDNRDLITDENIFTKHNHNH